MQIKWKNNEDRGDSWGLQTVFLVWCELGQLLQLQWSCTAFWLLRIQIVSYVLMEDLTPLTLG